MKKKRIAIALGHDALGTTLPEQKEATCRAAKAIADLIQDDVRWLSHTATDRRLE